jgi:hypothetical protein
MKTLGVCSSRGEFLGTAQADSRHVEPRAILPETARRLQSIDPDDAVGLLYWFIAVSSWIRTDNDFVQVRLLPAVSFGATHPLHQRLALCAAV